MLRKLRLNQKNSFLMKNNVYLNLIHLTFYEHQDWHGKHFKKTEMLLVVEKGIRGEIVYAIYQYATANNKYMKD